MIQTLPALRAMDLRIQPMGWGVLLTVCALWSYYVSDIREEVCV